MQKLQEVGKLPKIHSKPDTIYNNKMKTFRKSQNPFDSNLSLKSFQLPTSYDSVSVPLSSSSIGSCVSGSICSQRSRLPGAREYANCYVGGSRAGVRNGENLTFLMRK